jgi:hypothetical protein
MVRSAFERGDNVAATARSLETVDALVDTYGHALLPIALDVTDREVEQNAMSSVLRRVELAPVVTRGVRPSPRSRNSLGRNPDGGAPTGFDL